MSQNNIQNLEQEIHNIKNSLSYKLGRLVTFPARKLYDAFAKKEKEENVFFVLDKMFREVDKKQIYRTKNIRLIPEFKYRIGGKQSYAEWAHVIGIFQTIIYQTINVEKRNNILDISCGTGLLGISS